MTYHPDSIWRRLRPQVSQLAALAPLALLVTGCGLFETAGEVTLGKGQLPRVTQRIEWPNIDDMTGSALSGAAGATKDGEPLVTGLPGSLKKGSLAHVQGILGLAGDCQRSFTMPDLAKGGAVSNLEIRLTNCAGDDRCSALCGDFRGMRIEAGVDVLLLDEKKAKSLAAQLRQAKPEAAVEAIVQLRLRFFELKLFQNDDAGTEQDVTQRLDDLEMILSETAGELPENLEGPYSPETIDDPDAPSGATDVEQVPYVGPHWVKVLEGRYVARIDPTHPQRFEIDPTVPFSQRLKDTLVQGKPASLRLVMRLSIARPDLYELRFDGAGVEVDVQPEVVLSVLQLIKNL
jgi:hypothetical protein